MRWLLYMLSACTCFGQFNWRDVAFVGEATNVPASSFSPSDVAGLKFWFQPSTLTMTNEGGGVWYWPDSSGNGWYMTNATSAQWPYLTNTFNGESISALYFDGTDDGFYSSNATSLGVMNAKESCSIISVCRQSASTANKSIFLISRGSNNGARDQFYLSANEKLSHQSRTADTDGAASTEAPTVSDVSKAICVHITSMHTNSTMLLYTNNILAKNAAGPTTTNVTASTDSKVISLGFSSGSIPFLGEIAEVLVYVPSISDTDRDRVWSYLSNKFKITL